MEKMWRVRGSNCRPSGKKSAHLPITPWGICCLQGLHMHYIEETIIGKVAFFNFKHVLLWVEMSLLVHLYVFLHQKYCSIHKRTLGMICHESIRLNLLTDTAYNKKCAFVLNFTETRIMMFFCENLRLVLFKKLYSTKKKTECITDQWLRP